MTVSRDARPQRPTPVELRQWLCDLDLASEFDWRHTLGSLPGGVTFGEEKVERDQRPRPFTTVTRTLTFSTPSMRGSAQIVLNKYPLGGLLKVEGTNGPLFDSPKAARAFLVSLGFPRPMPLDPDVLRRTFGTTDSLPEDGLMAGRFIGDFDHGRTLVAINLRTNTMDVKFSVLDSYLSRMCRRVEGQPVVRPQAPDYVSDEFCAHFEELGELAKRGFSTLKGPAMADGEYRATLLLPEASDCRLSGSPPLFNCSWRNRPLDRIRGEFEVLARAIRACFPSAQSTPGDLSSVDERSFDLSIPQGERGGPSRVSVDLESDRIVLTVSAGN